MRQKRRGNRLEISDGEKTKDFYARSICNSDSVISEQTDRYRGFRLQTSVQPKMPPKAVFSEEKNPRGIPKAPFIVSVPKVSEAFGYLPRSLQADVEEYLGGPDAEVEGPLKNFQDALAYASLENISSP